MPTAAPAKPKRARSSAGGPKYPLPVDREAIKLSLIAGMTFRDAETTFNVKEMTLRKWAEREQWPIPGLRSKAARAGRILAGTEPSPLEMSRASNELAKQAIELTIPAISARNSLRAASEVDRSLAAVEKRKRPLPIQNWSEYSQAFRVLKLAAGETTEGAQVQLNIWGAGGIGSSTVAPAFRNVTPAAPAIDAPAGD